VKLAGISVALAALAACGASPQGGPDANNGSDGGSSGGMSLAFSIDPAVPGQVFPGATIDSVDLAIKDLRLTGDSASATDSRTHAGFLAISWRADHQPYPATFPAAPPGKYANIAFKLENDIGQSFVIKGSVMFLGNSHPYLIEDNHSVDISVPMDVELPVGGSASDTLETHMLGVLEGVDWANAEIESDGTLVVTSDSDLTNLRGRFVTAFTAASVSGGAH
jgi:hypothetical protein